MKNASFLKKNGLSLTLVALFLIFWIGQTLTGWQVYNDELMEDNAKAISFMSYLSSGHFISATFENWESEFLQMFIFVVFSIFLFQQGSPESKSLENDEDVNQKPNPKKSPHWMVRQGGFLMWCYANSLSIVLFLLFLLSFISHSYGSYKHHIIETELKHKSTESFGQYVSGSEFWFESFQNWQSEFLAVFVIVYFTVFLRQKGSPQSKKVDALDEDNGE